MTRTIYYVRRFILSLPKGNPLALPFRSLARRGVTVVAVLFVALLIALIGAHFSSSAQAEGLEIPELPGFENGTGTQFVIDDSDYHNITLTSTETVTLRVTSVTNLITIRVHDDPATASADFTISGLPAETTFYRYEDGFSSEVMFTTDASGTHTYTQDLTEDHLVYIQEQPSTFNVGGTGGGDCVLIGTWDEATTTCTLTENVTDTIFVDIDTTLNGAGHSVSGPTVGVYVSNNATLENLTITNVTQGVATSFGSFAFSGTTIRNNTISDASQWAIATDSGGHRIEGNSISSSGTLEPRGAIGMGQSGDPGPDTIIIGNTFENNANGIFALNDFPVDPGSSNFQILGNTITQDQSVAPFFGLGVLSYIDHILIAGNSFTHQEAGVALGADRNVVARNYFLDSFYGVYLVENPYKLDINGNPTPATRAQVYNNNFKDLGSDFFQGGYVGSDTPGSVAHRHVFSLPMPVAGNYWDIWSPGCTDPEPDLRCDPADAFDLGLINEDPDNIEGITDELPWTQLDGWFNATHGISAPPIVGHDSQTLTSSGSPIAEGATISEDAVTFSAQVLDLDGDNVELEVELREVGQPFTGIDDGGIHRSGFLSSDGVTRAPMTFTRFGLVNDSYHWRIRAVDEHGAASAWWEYGLPGVADFTVEGVADPNAAPDFVGNATQHRTNSEPIAHGETTSESTVFFRATANDPDGDNFRLQIEVREADAPFIGVFDSLDGAFIESGLVDSDSEAETARFGLTDGEYHWQARVVDANGNASAWVEYEDQQTGYDFKVQTAQEIKVAVILAEPSDMSFDTSHDQAYFEGFESKLRDYFCEVSFGDGIGSNCSGGLMELSVFDVYPPVGNSPYKITETAPDEMGVTQEATNKYFGEDTGFAHRIIDPTYCDPTKTCDPMNDEGRIKINDVDRTTEFAWLAINAADGPINYNNYDIVVSVHPGHSRQSSDPKDVDLMSTQIIPSFDFAPKTDSQERARRWAVISEFEELGTWAHEITHAFNLGGPYANAIVPDLYSDDKSGFFGNVYDWGLMGFDGPYLGEALDEPRGARPAHLSSFTKKYLGWLNGEFIEEGTHYIESAETLGYLDSVQQFGSANEYYILEARSVDPMYSYYDQALVDNSLVLYWVDRDDLLGLEIVNQIHSIPDDVSAVPWVDDELGVGFAVSGFAYPPAGMFIETNVSSQNSADTRIASLRPSRDIMHQVYDPSSPLAVPSSDIAGGFAQLTPTPTDIDAPSRSEIHERSVERAWQREGALMVRYGSWLFAALVLLLIHVVIWRRRKVGIFVQHPSVPIIILVLLVLLILLAGYLLMGRYMRYKRSIISSVEQQSSEYLAESDNNATYFAPLGIQKGDGPAPDLDLHAYDDQGNHVGMNYVTGEYENQIAGARASGDLSLAREWISVPEGTNVRFEVFSEDIERFFEENPDIAASLPSLEETYEFGAVTYDANGTRYEAIPVEDIAINAGEVIVHEIGGTTENPTVDQGTVDDTGPAIFHTSLNATYPYNSSSVEFDFSADDALSGVASVSATLNGNPITSGTTLTFDVLGDYQIVITAVDNAGNETIETIDYSVVDVVPPAVTHTALNASYLLNSPSVVFDFSATDDASGVASLSATLDGQALNSGDTITFDAPGDHQIVITATDNAGNQTVETIDFSVVYDFIGFQSPVKNDGSGIYKQGRTLPVKFELFDVNGVVIDDATATISMAFIESGISGTEEVALATGNTDSGNSFRWDDTQQLYIFNLDTTPMDPGTWEIYADLNDGTRHTVEVSIRD